MLFLLMNVLCEFIVFLGLILGDQFHCKMGDHCQPCQPALDELYWLFW